MKPVWKRIAKVKRGHAFFEDVNTGRVAIADGSGSTPERTEDGILWLDPTRPLSISVGRSYFGVSYPVISERDGKPHHSGDGLHCLDWLRDNVDAEPWQWQGDSVAVDHRFAQPIVDAIEAWPCEPDCPACLPCGADLDDDLEGADDDR